MRLLDVGCGWGSLSLHAAEQYGARVVGVTLSGEQEAYIEAALTERGLGNRVEIRVQDYRTITDGPFDAAASIEMGEHVGRHNYPTYAQIMHRCVRPGARVLIQQMSRRGSHPGGGPFIESFIGPDMHMRPLGQTIALLEEAGLATIAVEAMREHYVRTVDAWIDNLETHWDAAIELIGEEATRVWRLYLAGDGLRSCRGAWASIRSCWPGPPQVSETRRGDHGVDQRHQTLVNADCLADGDVMRHRLHQRRGLPDPRIESRAPYGPGRRRPGSTHGRQRVAVHCDPRVRRAVLKRTRAGRSAHRRAAGVRCRTNGVRCTDHRGRLSVDVRGVRAFPAGSAAVCTGQQPHAAVRPRSVTV